MSAQTKTGKTVAIIGTGPAGLMAAEVILRAGHAVTLYEKKNGPGRKLLIAGSSGLNISHEGTAQDYWKNYRGPAEHFQALFRIFPSEAWLDFIHSLGINTFVGTSHRHFVEGLKAAPLLRAWIGRLSEQGTTFQYGRELTGFERRADGRIALSFGPEIHEFDAVCFALGGGSYVAPEVPLRWPAIFRENGIQFKDFRASNVGYEVEWSAGLLQEAEGLPLKTIVLKSSLGEKSGDLMITRYGLEGTPIYHAGETGEVLIDLKPGLSHEEILKKLRGVKENLAPIRRVKKQLSLCPASLALVFHETPKGILEDTEKLAHRLKNFRLYLKGPRPLEEAISSAGGLSFEEVTPTLMLKKFPGVFAAGEMLDWDAPTGGFLIQGCASQGYLAGTGMVAFLSTDTPPRSGLFQ